MYVCMNACWVVLVGLKAGLGRPFFAGRSMVFTSVSCWLPLTTSYLGKFVASFRFAFFPFCLLIRCMFYLLFRSETTLKVFYVSRSSLKSFIKIMFAFLEGRNRGRKRERGREMVTTIIPNQNHLSVHYSRNGSNICRPSAYSKWIFSVGLQQSNISKPAKMTLGHN